MESLRLFHYAENTKWNLLPVAGSLYDQHPRLLDEWDIIWAEKAKADAETAKANEPKSRRRK